MDNAISEDLAKNKWELKKETEYIKVWIKYGSDFHKKLPVVRVESLYPNIDDPEIIFRALNE